VSDPALSLADLANGLPFAAQNGSFQIITTDVDGTTHTTDIFIKIGVGGVPDTTLNDLQAAIDAIAGLSAIVTSDGKLSITAAAGYSFTFADDSSQVLAALGINTFFTGRQAYDMAVNDLVANNIDLIAASSDGSVGDGTNAQRIADVLTTPSSVLNDVSIEDYYNRMVSDMAVTTAAAISGTQASEVIVDSLVAQREAVSGVSLDEEALQLIRFERAFQGASRYLTVVDAMIAEVLNLAR
jgi:flagellar hook-associated protein 1 FlgK